MYASPGWVMQLLAGSRVIAAPQAPRAPQARPLGRAAPPSDPQPRRRRGRAPKTARMRMRYKYTPWHANKAVFRAGFSVCVFSRDYTDACVLTTHTRTHTYIHPYTYMQCCRGDGDTFCVLANVMSESTASSPSLLARLTTGVRSLLAGAGDRGLQLAASQWDSCCRDALRVAGGAGGHIDPRRGTRV